MKKEDFKKIKKIKEACIENAKNLIETAKKIDSPNIQFHLSILAIEEIGKINICFHKILNKSLEGKIRLNENIDDHARKLFTVLFDLGGIEKIVSDPKTLPDLQSIAKNIHNKRLKSIYVEPESCQVPKNIINKKEAKEMIDFAQFVIEREERYILKEKEGNDEDFIWFMKASEDKELNQFIFRKSCFEKLNEFKEMGDWIKWIRNEFEKQKHELHQISMEELGVKEIKVTESKKKKWKIKIRIFSYSHSVRQKVINKWNSKDSSIKLYATNKKNEFIFELTAPITTHVTSIFDYTLNYTKVFLISLNIGTMGYFWYFLPHMTKRFYDEIIDLENKIPLIIENKEIPDIKSFENAVLDNEDIKNQQKVFVYISDMLEMGILNFLNLYFMGLVVVSKIDLLFRSELNAFNYFYVAFKEALIFHEDWDNKKPLKKIIEKFFYKPEKELSNEIISEFSDLIEIGGKIEQKQISFQKINEEVNLEKVFRMKTCFDMYILMKSFMHLEKKYNEGKKSNNKDI